MTLPTPDGARIHDRRSLYIHALRKALAREFGQALRTRELDEYEVMGNPRLFRIRSIAKGKAILG